MLQREAKAPMIAHRSMESKKQNSQGISGNSNSNHRRKTSRTVSKDAFLWSVSSCRSQLAKAFLRKYAGRRLTAQIMT
jgi:hypothetical protein